MKYLTEDPNGDTDDGSYEIDVIDLAKKIEVVSSSKITVPRPNMK